MIWIYLLSLNSQAHLMGTSPLCVANSPVHFECFYEDFEQCEKVAKRRSNPIDRWECVRFPIDFRKLPKSGEEPIKKNN